MTPAGGVVMGVSIGSVILLTGALYYQIVSGAPGAEPQALQDLANTIGIGGLAVFALVEFGSLVFGR